MMRLVVLGNSHIAALHGAWNTVETPPDGLEIAFLGGISPVFNMMTLGPGQVFGLHDPGPLSPEQVRRNRRLFGSDTVDLTAVDGVAIVGVDWNVWALIDLLGTMTIDGIDAPDAEPGGRRLSANAFEAIVAALADEALNRIDWATRIDAPTFVIPRPIPPETLLAPTESGDPASPEAARAVAWGFTSAVNILADAFTDAAQARGMAVVPQPAATRAPSGLTALAYKRDALRLVNKAQADGSEDFEHMNRAYGKACLDALMTRLVADRGLAFPNLTDT